MHIAHNAFMPKGNVALTFDGLLTIMALVFCHVNLLLAFHVEVTRLPKLLLTPAHSIRNEAVHAGIWTRPGSLEVLPHT